MNLTRDGRILFSHDELKCPAAGEVRLDSTFAKALADLRVAFDRPMTPTSCCRSTVYNRQIRGHPRSLHVFDAPHHAVGGTCAIDIAATDGIYRRELVALAVDAGWSVGVATNFVHLDWRQAAGLAPVLYGYGR